MFSLTRIQFLKFAATGAIVATIAASTPVRADEMVQNLGPVGPHEPILATVGSKRFIAFYVPGSGHCAVNAVVWDGDDTEGNTAARVWVSLNPGETVQIDTVESKSLTLRCGDYAETLDTVADIASK